MKLKDVYDQLAFGALRQLFLGTGKIDTVVKGEDGVPRENWTKLLPAVRLGLTALHKRFLLREGELTIELQPNQAVYIIDRDYAASNSDATGTQYILDTAAPFLDDLMQVESVWGTYQEKEYEIPLNKMGNPNTIRTTAYNHLVVPEDNTKALWLKETTKLRVVYRADHPTIESYEVKSNPGETTIYLPPAFLEALCLFVASQLTNPNGMMNEMHEGNNYLQKYENEIRILQGTNVARDEFEEIDKFNDRGFV